jgi:hypothetical protein
MPTDYSTLGFPVEKRKHLKKLAKQVLPLATEVSSPKGKFLCWAPGSGEELWLKLNDRDQVFTRERALFGLVQGARRLGRGDLA